jgi:hypothetical protein
MKRLLIVFLVTNLCGLVSQVMAESTDLFEGFEGKFRWMAVGKAWKDGDSSLKGSQSGAWASEGKNSMECEFLLSGSKEATFMIEKDLNWSPYKAALIDVKNGTGKTLKVSFIVNTGANWSWYETQKTTIKPGVTKNIKFNFNDKIWKSPETEKSDKPYVAALKGQKACHRIAVRIDGEKGVKGSCCIDNIRLVK